jgi:hypothetical protein
MNRIVVDVQCIVPKASLWDKKSIIVVMPVANKKPANFFKSTGPS